MSKFKYRLDEGSGKDLSLDECPREQLEKEVRRKHSCIYPILTKWNLCSESREY